MAFANITLESVYHTGLIKDNTHIYPRIPTYDDCNCNKPSPTCVHQLKFQLFSDVGGRSSYDREWRIATDNASEYFVPLRNNTVLTYMWIPLVAVYTCVHVQMKSCTERVTGV